MGRGAGGLRQCLNLGCLFFLMASLPFFFYKKKYQKKMFTQIFFPKFSFYQKKIVTKNLPLTIFFQTNFFLVIFSTFFGPKIFLALKNLN